MADGKEMHLEACSSMRMGMCANGGLGVDGSGQFRDELEVVWSKRLAPAWLIALAAVALSVAQDTEVILGEGRGSTDAAVSSNRELTVPTTSPADPIYPHPQG